ncbi:MAG TPA: hypothetical protein VM890_06755, partial [Longimicrobium sp.]|nr:hypothetical protein [Longimicrobium sp.]
NGKKLRLSVEELKVEAFATAEGAVERGTVHGRDGTVTDPGYSCIGPDPAFCRLTYPGTGCDC